MDANINGPGVQMGMDAAVHMQTPDVPTDVEGRTFDPQLHRVKRDGSPVLGPSGRLTRKSQPKPESPTIEGGNGQASSGAGVAAAQITFALATMYGGPSWRPNPGEIQAMTDAWAGVMDYYGVQEIHPVVTLVCVVAAYAQPRLAEPDTASRIRSWWLRVRHGRRHAYTDSGDNGLRQDDIGNPNSGRVQ